MNFLNKLLFFIIIFSTTLVPTLAWNLDLTVDDEIRKNYNPDKLEAEALPPLPSIATPKNKQNDDTKQSEKTSTTQQSPSSLPKTTPTTETQKEVIRQTAPITQTQLPSNLAAAKIKKGTKFKVKLATNISDKCKPGAGLTFVNQSPVTVTYLTIPSQTKFKGVIVDSHRPQLSGNGGLIVITVNSANIKGQQIPIKAYITKANHKKIFFNNIKGERKYWKNAVASTEKGRNYFKKMWKVTKSLSKDAGTIILTPFSLATGTVVVGVNFLMSPLFAVFSKGGSISIPAGTNFEIKLLEDVYVYN